MKLKDATRFFGSVGILLPLILIFLIAADAAYACPEHRTVAYRTKVIKRSGSIMPTTVITYGGPAALRGCSDSSRVTRGVRYVAVRGDSYYNAPRYVAVRNSVSYVPTRRVRYVSVRNADMDAPRYVVVNRRPAYVQRQAKVFVVKDADLDDASRFIPVERYSNGTRYVAVRSGYRTGNGIVAYMDVDDSPRRVVVSRTPVYTQTRYVAVRNDDDDDYVRPVKYVAVRNVRNACTCADTLNSSLGQIETRASGHVVVKSDYIDGTEDVVYRGEVVNDTYAVNNVSFDDNDDLYPVSPAVKTNYIADDDDDDLYPVSPAVRTNYVGYRETVVPARVTVMPASYAVYDDTSEMPAEFIPAAYDDDDFDDDAIIDNGSVTYVADTDIDDACLRTVAVQAPMEYRVRTVSYVPVVDVDDVEDVDDIDDVDSSDVSMLYGWNDGSDSAIATVPVINRDLVDTGTTYVVADDMSTSCSCPIAANVIDDDVDVDTVSYVPASYVADVDTDVDDVNYVPVDDVDTDNISYTPVEDVDTTVSYLPDSAMDADEPSYVPESTVAHVDVVDMPADDMSMAVADVGEPIADNVDSSIAMVEENNVIVADMASTQAVAGENGYNDGLADGRAAALNLRQNLPGESLNFQNATNGYAETIGDPMIYQNAYRSSYLQGFSEAYNAAIGAS